MTKIQQTEDYSSFKRIGGNRTLNKAQVRKLYDSLGENPELASAVPIIVNDKMEIIDGQHRFEALKKLGLPISYLMISGLNLSAVQIINSSTKVWSPVDYAKSYSELGNENYKIYLEFKKKYHLAHQVLLSYLGGRKTGSGGSTVQTFRRGKFKIDDVEKAHKLCQQLSDISQYYKRGDSRPFAYAFRQVAEHPQYDHARMMAKVKERYTTFKDSPFSEDYMRQLEKIYNFHCGVNRVKLF